MTYAPITIQARRVLLDALEALEDHRAQDLLERLADIEVAGGR